jgi:hypothetical protein
MLSFALSEICMVIWIFQKFSRLTLRRLNVKYTFNDYSTNLDAASGEGMAGGALGVAGGSAARGEDCSGQGILRFGVPEL